MDQFYKLGQALALAEGGLQRVSTKKLKCGDYVNSVMNHVLNEKCNVKQLDYHLQNLKGDINSYENVLKHVHLSYEMHII